MIGSRSQGQRRARDSEIGSDDGCGAASRIGRAGSLRPHGSDRGLCGLGSGPVKQSGKYQGQTKLSKRGSGRVRRILYLAALRSIQLDDSPFGAYYRRLVHRGMKKGMAVVAVMRKLLIVAAHLILTEQVYEPGKVAGLAVR